VKTNHLVGTLLSPRATFASLADAPRGAGTVPVVVAGTAWAALSVVLAANGESPSRPAPFIPDDVHYLAQAIFVVPLFLVSWLVLSVVASRIARGRAHAPLGYAYGLPLLVTWAIPDAIAYGVFGFGSLAPLVRVVAPATAVYTLFLASRAVRAATGCSSGRAFAAAIAGLLAQALVGAWALR
jgi:hypothetical protein